MASVFIHIALLLAGLAILTDGLYFWNRGKRLKGAVIAMALLIAAAFVIAAIAP